MIAPRLDGVTWDGRTDRTPKYRGILYCSSSAPNETDELSVPFGKIISDPRGSASRIPQKITHYNRCNWSTPMCTVHQEADTVSASLASTRAPHRALLVALPGAVWRLELEDLVTWDDPWNIEEPGSWDLTHPSSCDAPTVDRGKTPIHGLHVERTVRHFVVSSSSGRKLPPGRRPPITDAAGGRPQKIRSVSSVDLTPPTTTTSSSACKRQADQSSSAFRPHPPPPITTPRSSSRTKPPPLLSPYKRRPRLPPRCTASRRTQPTRYSARTQATAGETRFEEGKKGREQEHHGHGVVAEPERAALHPGGIPAGGGLLPAVVGAGPDDRLVPRSLGPAAPAPRGAARRRARGPAGRPARHRGPPLLRPARPQPPAAVSGAVARRRAPRNHLAARRSVSVGPAAAQALRWQARRAARRVRRRRAPRHPPAALESSFSVAVGAAGAAV